MNKRDLTLVGAAGYLAATAGFIWLFGPIPLIVSGVLLLVMAFAVDVKED